MNKKLIIGLLSSTVVISGFLFAAWGSDASLTANPKRKISSEHKSDNKMKVEIWSDVMCPFCYIGKKKFETAWNEFAAKNKVEIEWKSFQIMPGLQTQPDRSIHEVLVDQKRISLEQAKQFLHPKCYRTKMIFMTRHYEGARGAVICDLQLSLVIELEAK